MKPKLAVDVELPDAPTNLVVSTIETGGALDLTWSASDRTSRSRGIRRITFDGLRRSLRGNRRYTECGATAMRGSKTASSISM